MALTESKVSAICCNLFEQDGERSEGGKVTTITAFEDRAKPFSDLIKESICHSYNNNINTFQIRKTLKIYRMKNNINS